MENNFSVVNITKGKLPSLPFVMFKNDILGKKYSFSLAFIGEKKMREINKTYRNKDKSTNILSFFLSKTEGEMLICPAVIKRETKKPARLNSRSGGFNKNFRELLGFLVIHGMLHLKGLEHGKKMEKLENFYCKKFKIN
ncbi:MAG: rRNA maturation RNase YbeY [Patescibacteria group bacterium]